MHKYIPNSLTILRIALIPFIAFFAFEHNKTAVALLFALGGLTDALDGFIARKLKVNSAFGSALDTIADVLFYPCALFLYFFVPHAITENIVILSVTFGLLALSVIICAIFKKLSMPHALSAKATSASLYVLVIITLLFGHIQILVYAVCILGIIAAIDKIWRCARTQ